MAIGSPNILDLQLEGQKDQNPIENRNIQMAGNNAAMGAGFNQQTQNLNVELVDMHAQFDPEKGAFGLASQVQNIEKNMLPPYSLHPGNESSFFSEKDHVEKNGFFSLFRGKKKSDTKAKGFGFLKSFRFTEPKTESAVANAPNNSWLNKISRPQLYLLITLGILVAGYFVVSIDPENLDVFSFFSDENVEDNAQKEEELRALEEKMKAKKADDEQKKAEMDAKSKILADAERERAKAISSENPYWFLANANSDDNSAFPDSWTTEQEDAWRSAIMGKAMWPKYKALLQVRSLHLSGSQIILTDLSKGKKFWLRMMSLMALADFGEDISLEQVENAVKGVPSELFARFMSRFEDESTAGERFILRAAIRIADESGRLAILRSLAAKPDKFLHLYLVAGSFDPSRKVKNLANKLINRAKILRKSDLEEVVRGNRQFDQIDPTAPLKKGKNAKSNSELAKGEVPSAKASNLVNGQVNNQNVTDPGLAAEDLNAVTEPDKKETHSSAEVETNPSETQGDQGVIESEGKSEDEAFSVKDIFIIK